MVLITGNETAIIGLTSITGSFFLSLLVLVILIMLFALALRIPLEFTAIFILPLLIVLVGYESQLLSVFGVLLLYLGVLFGKHFFFSK